MDNVLEWISDHVESHRFDAHSLSLALCSVDGYSLCQMSQDQMMEAFGPQIGSHLYQNLQEHKNKYGKPRDRCERRAPGGGVFICFLTSAFADLQNLPGPPELNDTCQILDNLLDNFPLLSTIIIRPGRQLSAR